MAERMLDSAAGVDPDGRTRGRPAAGGPGAAPCPAADGDWYAGYVGHAYRSAVGRTLAAAGSSSARVLKTDLWDETLGGARDILGDLAARRAGWGAGIDLELGVCVSARARVPGLRAVQADIRALPFRSGCFDAVLDLSTLDHVPEADSASATAEYGRVLRDGGMLLLVFWQRNLLVRLRLAVKRLLGRSEKPDQHYLSRRGVLGGLDGDLVVGGSFVAGSLLVAPLPVVGAVLRALPPGAAARLVRWVVSCEVCGPLQPLLRSVAGLYGVRARRRPRPAQP